MDSAMRISSTNLRTSYICLLLLLSGCGGGGGGSDAPAMVPEAPTASDEGFLTLLITDAAVDTAIEVWVEFTSVELKPKDGESFTIDFEEPKTIDLLTLSGEATEPLLSDEPIDSGEYNWIRLDVNADEDGIFDSYVLTELGEMIELEVTSQQGLRLVSGFTVGAGGSTNFVIDWDLRKGLTIPKGVNKDSWKLKPALRITDLNVDGELSGMVAEELLTAESCTNDLAEDTGNAVYLYEGLDVVPEDIHTEETDPVATTDVKQDENGMYQYEMNYIGPGDYTIAFTCQALDDEADTDDEIVFAESANITLAEEEEGTHDFGSEG
jgi:hypothetical protein